MNRLIFFAIALVSYPSFAGNHLVAVPESCTRRLLRPEVFNPEILAVLTGNYLKRLDGLKQNLATMLERATNGFDRGQLAAVYAQVVTAERRIRSIAEQLPDPVRFATEMDFEMNHISAIAGNTCSVIDHPLAFCAQIQP